jgi:hypothetical protein
MTDILDRPPLWCPTCRTGHEPCDTVIAIGCDFWHCPEDAADGERFCADHLHEYRAERWDD